MESANLERAAATSPDGAPKASTDVPTPRAVLLALPVYAAFVGVAMVSPKYVHDLLLQRGWVPHAILQLTALAVVILVLKAIGLRRERAAFRDDLLPEGVTHVTRTNVAEVAAHVDALATWHEKPTFLVERARRVLAHFGARGDAAETSAANVAEADAEAGAVAGSFALLKVMIWAIPILGLIGTVMGISEAVGGFSKSLDGAEQIDSIKSSLGDVTVGLAVAFDNTLVALVASILLMLPTSALQKAEDRLLGAVDDRVLADLVRRFAPPPPPLPLALAAPADGDLRERIAEAVSAPLAELLAANARLMERMTEDRAALTSAQEALHVELSAFAVAATRLGPIVERAVRALETATSQAERGAAGATRAHEALASELATSRRLFARLAGEEDDAEPHDGGRKPNGTNGNGTNGNAGTNGTNGSAGHVATALANAGG